VICDAYYVANDLKGCEAPQHLHDTIIASAKGKIPTRHELCERRIPIGSVVRPEGLTG
jgi:hypothetical protein